jgi:hypothetical protein
MKRNLFGIIAMLVAVIALAPKVWAQSTAEDIKKHFDGENKKVLEMAKDFPDDKYDFRINPQTRTFGEVVLHVASGNNYAAKTAGGTKAEFEDLTLKDYPNKAAIVAALEKSIAAADEALSKESADALSKNSAPWVGIIQHNAEQYGTLAGYYRAAGMVPPASRPKK